MKNKTAMQSKKFRMALLGVAVLGGALITSMVMETEYNLYTALVMGILSLALATTVIAYVAKQAVLDQFLETVSGALTEKRMDTAKRFAGDGARKKEREQ